MRLSTIRGLSDQGGASARPGILAGFERGQGRGLTVAVGRREYASRVVCADWDRITWGSVCVDRPGARSSRKELMTGVAAGARRLGFVVAESELTRPERGRGAGP